MGLTKRLHELRDANNAGYANSGPLLIVPLSLDELIQLDDEHSNPLIASPHDFVFIYSRYRLKDQELKGFLQPTLEELR